MSRVTAAQWEQLAAAALVARRNAYAPYSRYKVGAALLAGSGEVFSGGTVENASYGLCICAERNAITTAVAAGRREIRAIAVATADSPPAPPCGMCLQFMAEFCVDIDLLLVNTSGERRRTRLLRLMREPFRWKGAGA